MDDLIVIILTLAVAVIGVINQQKKKKAAQNPAGKVTKQPTDFWDMIMDAQNEQAENVPEYVEPQTEFEEYKEPEDKIEYQFVPSSEGITEIENETKVISKKKLQATVDGEEFSLRKAVIYNEILQRKYT
ncbi:hypothetical protein OU798_20305 [Prolixibacteraceae bacterium Z1-6]|uniref:Uncharacterized protein n=1 Tax=Draconibacterium aestuarii TaxID=2998507 RepID=A0A9X3F8X9_9BACT|nr:hypothetical protein [Prolixibacteraceae bacterium Z1-6]